MAFYLPKNLLELGGTLPSLRFACAEYLTAAAACRAAAMQSWQRPCPGQTTPAHAPCWLDQYLLHRRNSLASAGRTVLCWLAAPPSIPLVAVVGVAAGFLPNLGLESPSWEEPALEVLVVQPYSALPLAAVCLAEPLSRL